jgi:hypothetical protein
MVQSTGPCPTDLQEVVEAYFMHRLTEDEADAFEEHYFVCPHCAIILQKTGACVEAMRAAARKVTLDASGLD